MFKDIPRYLYERPVSTVIWILNIFALCIGTHDSLFGMLLLDIGFILRGIIWEGMKDDRYKELTK